MRVNTEKECRKEFVGLGRVFCGANRTTGIFIIVLATMVVSGLGAPSPQGSLSLYNRNFAGPRNSAIRIATPSNSAGQDSLLTSALSINSAVSSGQISREQARIEAQRLIQANKQANNLQILNQTFGK